ncbi:MAG: hypothetical protein AAGJ18_25555, partial [Bacteroidota bacterium]
INYWSVNYEDYAWDELAQKFTNQQLFSSELDAYDKYFRRLNSTNDTVAYKAFLALCEGKPNEIAALLKKFKPLLRNYNLSLPPLKYKILEQVSQLSYFCQAHNLVYKPNEALEFSLEKLKGQLTPKQRVDLENKLIEQLSIFELTPLEYYAAIYAQNLPLNYSIGRILDHSYTKHWSAILKNEYQFRLFLYKTELFRRFGGFGICKSYESKINLTNPKTLNLLHNLDRLETNALIRESVAYFLGQKTESSNAKKIAKFLDTPADFEKTALRNLPPFEANDIPLIVQSLFQQEEKTAINNIGAYLELYASVDIIPQLFEAPKKQWLANKYLGKAIVKILEKVYRYSFARKSDESIRAWWELWQTNPENYPDWSKDLFAQQLDKLRQSQSLTIEDINTVAISTHYTPEYRSLCLDALRRVTRSRTIYRLKLAPKISVKSELNYLVNIDFSAKALGNLPKIFEVDDPAKLLNFIVKKSTQADNKTKSALFNSLFRQAWFINHITSGQIAPAKCNIIKLVFYQYLSNSTFLTEYEEQTTQLNIVHLENAYLSLKEKLERIAGDSLNMAIRYDYLNATLSRMEFPEIVVAFPILQDLTIADKNLFLFLNKDFGLPIFEVSTQAKANGILEKLKNYNEFEFYEQVLLDFGLPITDETGQLDFEKIYEILTYDLVVPFLGDGGKYRDYYCYGIVKLLELHFKTTLGFHPKLNENQTFYTFNSSSRAGWQTSTWPSNPSDVLKSETVP